MKNSLCFILCICFFMVSCSKLEVINENFDNNDKNWHLVDKNKSPMSYSEIKDGKLLFFIEKSEKELHNFSAIGVSSFDDGLSHSIKTKFKVNFLDNGKPCGLIWGADPTNIFNSYYFFGYKANGHVFISRENTINSMNSKTYLDQKFDFIKLNEYNSFEIRKENTDGDYTFYVNNQLVYTLSPPYYVVDSAYGFLTFSPMEVEDFNISYTPL